MYIYPGFQFVEQATERDIEIETAVDQMTSALRMFSFADSSASSSELVQKTVLMLKALKFKSLLNKKKLGLDPSSCLIVDPYASRTLKEKIDEINREVVIPFVSADIELTAIEASKACLSANLISDAADITSIYCKHAHLNKLHSRIRNFAD